jgi:antitoxin HicB
MKKNKHIGSNFDDFLAEDGLLAEAEAAAVKRVVAYQIQEMMEKKELSKSEFAKRMNTSRSSLDRLLDPNNVSITLQTLEKAAIALDKRLEVKMA